MTLSLGERIAQDQRNRQQNEVLSTYWNPDDIKGLEKVLIEDLPEDKKFSILPLSEASKAKDYKQGTTLLVFHRFVKVLRKNVEQKVTLYEGGNLVGTQIDLKTVIPNA